jgi:hypothetical protein
MTDLTTNMSVARDMRSYERVLRDGRDIRPT